MRTATLAATLALFASSCTPEPPPKAAEAPKPVQQAVKNISYFDLGLLEPAPPAVPGKVGNGALLGVELLSRPFVVECLVDARNRGPDPKSKVVVDAKLTDAGVEHKVGGENLTPSGVACIEAALAKWTAASQGLSAKNATGAAVTAHVEFQHLVGADPAVVLGINDVSDVAAAVRLATPTWGDCFAEWKGVPPRPLKATIKVTRPAAPAASASSAAPAAPPAPEVLIADATFDADPDPVATKVAACLKTKLGALKVKTPKDETVIFPYAFHFVNSSISATLPSALPHVQFIQLDLQRARSLAEVTIGAGSRDTAWTVFDASVKTYKESRGKTPTLKELKDRCDALVHSDDQLIGAVEKQVVTEQTAQSFTVDQKAGPDAETAAAKNVADAQKDLEKYKGYRKLDEAGCPKVKL